MNDEKRKIIRSLFFPGLFVFILWLVKIFEITTHINLSVYGLQPLHWKGLIGVLTCPFLHGDLSHLFANSVPLFLLGGMLIYFYREIAVQVFLLTWLLTGFWVWCLASADSIHIGASGVVYGLASFLFFSGIIRRESKLMALTLLVAFLYGGMVWGVFPQLFPLKKISWESHVMGLLCGVVLAIYFRKIGTQRKRYEWEDDDDESGSVEYDENADPDSGEKKNLIHPPEEPGDPSNREGPEIRYHYKE